MEEIYEGMKEQIKHLENTRDVVHKYSKGVGKIIDLALSYVYDIEARGLNGENVVWTMGISDTPLFYACDSIPLAITELGRLGSRRAMEIAEDHLQMPREVCSMVKILAGEYYLRQDKTVKKIHHNGTICEPINITFDLLGKYGYDVKTSDVGFKPVDITDERYEDLFKHYINEVKKTAEWINGKPLDEEKLGRQIKRYNRIMRKVRTIMNLRRSHATYIKSIPAMFTILGSTHYFGKPDEYEEALDLLIEELSSLKPGEYDDPVVRLVWSGGRGQEFGVYEAIDDAGGAILGWNIPNTFEFGFDESLPPLESFVNYQLGGRNGGAVGESYIVVEEQVKKAEAKGIILYGYVGCSLGSIRTELIRNHFKKKDIPSISIEGSFQVGPPTGQLLTRVKAFIEMLS